MGSSLRSLIVNISRRPYGQEQGIRDNQQFKTNGNIETSHRASTSGTTAFSTFNPNNDLCWMAGLWGIPVIQSNHPGIFFIRVRNNPRIRGSGPGHTGRAAAKQVIHVWQRPSIPFLQLGSWIAGESVCDGLCKRLYVWYQPVNNSLMQLIQWKL